NEQCCALTNGLYSMSTAIAVTLRLNVVTLSLNVLALWLNAVTLRLNAVTLRLNAVTLCRVCIVDLHPQS
ncbi:hypothetical protein, partial [Nostoc sp. UHCC 0252]|uniref:hypothetical protein n=1 Tax=Nostoc sp. UHCC 0252 TaxID=3110241 RepID=UPI002B3C0356|nr:hypothetical protein [Nostoc sp. UHCC 0252]